MKKVLICGVIAAAMGITAAHAAGTAASTFQVKANLAATCKATNSATQVIDFGNVTAFVAATPSGTANLTFSCTLGLAPSASLDATSGTVSGLPYTLSVPATVAAAAGGTAATGDAFTFPVTGNMTVTATTAGDTADAAVKTHTLTIAF